jgi:hypothetical protein
MTLQEFVKIKYWDKFIDLKKVSKEYKQNEKDTKRYYVLKGKWETNTFEFLDLKNSIIW